jgi:hypothetical protein
MLQLLIFPHAPQAEPALLHVCEPVPLPTAQLCWALGVQTFATHAPFCRLKPELQLVIFPQEFQAEPALLQVCEPVPLPTAQLCWALGVQTFAVHTPFCRLNPLLQLIRFPHALQVVPVELQVCEPVPLFTWQLCCEFGMHILIFGTDSVDCEELKFRDLNPLPHAVSIEAMINVAI